MKFKGGIHYGISIKYLVILINWPYNLNFIIELMGFRQASSFPWQSRELPWL
jgi:hypothetical protein